MINFISLLWIFFAYLLGSIPFGYIITRLSTKKNILEIGWRKTSGSNVFRYVGKWQGGLTGILDVTKGFLAVRLAQNFGYSLSIQILSGVAAIIGHNWSLFLKFAGGRGIGTFLGALFSFRSKILGLSIIPFLLSALILNTSIGTILFFIFALALSVYFDQFKSIGVFTLLSLVPIFIKRLSPVREIFPLTKNFSLIRNRLIFDNDQLCLDWRIKRIIKRLTKK